MSRATRISYGSVPPWTLWWGMQSSITVPVASILMTSGLWKTTASMRRRCSPLRGHWLRLPSGDHRAAAALRGPKQRGASTAVERRNAAQSVVGMEHPWQGPCIPFSIPTFVARGVLDMVRNPGQYVAGRSLKPSLQDEYVRVSKQHLDFDVSGLHGCETRYLVIPNMSDEVQRVTIAPSSLTINGLSLGDVALMLLREASEALELVGSTTEEGASDGSPDPGRLMSSAALDTRQRDALSYVWVTGAAGGVGGYATAQSHSSHASAGVHGFPPTFVPRGPACITLLRASMGKDALDLRYLLSTTAAQRLAEGIHATGGQNRSYSFFPSPFRVGLPRYGPAAGDVCGGLDILEAVQDVILVGSTVDIWAAPPSTRGRGAVSSNRPVSAVALDELDSRALLEQYAQALMHCGTPVGTGVAVSAAGAHVGADGSPDDALSGKGAAVSVGADNTLGQSSRDGQSADYVRHDVAEGLLTLQPLPTSVDVSVECPVAMHNMLASAGGPRGGRKRGTATDSGGTGGGGGKGGSGGISGVGSAAGGVQNPPGALLGLQTPPGRTDPHWRDGRGAQQVVSLPIWHHWIGTVIPPGMSVLVPVVFAPSTFLQPEFWFTWFAHETLMCSLATAPGSERGRAAGTAGGAAGVVRGECGRRSG